MSGEDLFSSSEQPDVQKLGPRSASAVPGLTSARQGRHAEATFRNQPLAARMRPRTLDEFVGQGHFLGPGKLLRRLLQADRLQSAIFYGPPGTGKTSLARVIANQTKAHFVALNAVAAGIKEVRDVLLEARDRLEV